MIPTAPPVERELSFACAPYDRLTPLLVGEVPVDGVRIRPVPITRPTEIFRRMIGERPFDVAEMSLSQTVRAAGRPDAPFRAIPVFTSRCFRHGYVFVDRRAGIESPADLAGRRIGVQHHGMSAAVWIRSALRTQFGVDLSGVTWVEGPVNPGAGDVTVERPGPRDLAVETLRAGEPGQTLSEQLAAGGIDAIIGAWVPDSFHASEDVVRLFPDHRAVELDYHRATGIFPIMHTLAVRSDLVEELPDLAALLYDACVRSRDLAWEHHRSTGALSTMLPWLLDDLAEVDAALGEGFWSYGVEANLPVLEAFAEQLLLEGAIAQMPDWDEVFLLRG
ncbi:ABC transporter substrate-binding protein [Nocardioides fonticola]|uniref:ABC transporter substrate-binding protein n=2 Tax=Nocardioides fonticola TaxID=450363 RepID=A0ABP7XF38_9ACTN